MKYKKEEGWERRGVRNGKRVVEKNKGKLSFLSSNHSLTQQQPRKRRDLKEISDFTFCLIFLLCFLLLDDTAKCVTIVIGLA